MSVALSLLLAGTLLAAAAAKLRDPSALTTTLATLRAGDEPRPHEGPASSRAVFAVPAVEAGLALALLAGAGRLASVACLALLALFTGILRVLERRAVPCACFGTTPSTGGVARNAALIAVAAALVAAPATAVWTLSLTELFGAATAALGAACAWSLARALT